MKSTDVELTTGASHTAEAEVNCGDVAKTKSPYGKFKDAESLLKAYESLESEFTRRSQRLKAVEGELLSRFQEEKTAEKAEESKVNKDEDFVGRYPKSSEFTDDIEKELNNSSCKEQAYIKILERKLDDAKNNLHEKERNCSFNEDFESQVIKDYLKKVMQAKPKAQVLSGSLLSVPPLKPTTIAEASVMAKKYIKRKGE